MLLFSFAILGLPTPSLSAAFTPLWETLPATPRLPQTIDTGYVNSTYGASIWYGVFGRALSETAERGGIPVLFLHGGFANSDYWGYQIAALNDVRRSILAIDTRGHGRSLDGTEPEMTYDIIANDAIAVLDHLNVAKVAVVGWSDGGITGLNLAMNYNCRVDRVFAFAASYNPDNIPDSISSSTVFNAFLNRSMEEYEALNPDPAHFPVFEQKMNTMWATEPRWDATSFAHIPTPYDNTEAPLIRIADGDHDEAITWTTPLQLQEWIPASGRTILPDVSHFAGVPSPVFGLSGRLFINSEADAGERAVDKERELQRRNVQCRKSSLLAVNEGVVSEADWNASITKLQDGLEDGKNNLLEYDLQALPLSLRPYQYGRKHEKEVLALVCNDRVDEYSI